MSIEKVEISVNISKHKEENNIKESKIWDFFIQAWIGMQYLHTRKILHRDIKTINLFLTKDEQIKIGDLGVAKTMKGINFAHTLVGTPLFVRKPPPPPGGGGGVSERSIFLFENTPTPPAPYSILSLFNFLTNILTDIILYYS